MAPPAATSPAAPPRPSIPLSEIRWVPNDLRALDDAPAELLVLTAFSDERPLEGLAGLIDWRLCGALSAWRMGGFSTGALGERILYPSAHRLAQERLLFVGLGRREEFRSDRAHAIAEAVLEAAIGLGTVHLMTGLFRLEGLPSPLERTGPKLVHLLRSAPGLTRLTLVADEASAKMVKDGIQFFGR